MTTLIKAELGLQPLVSFFVVVVFLAVLPNGAPSVVLAGHFE